VDRLLEASVRAPDSYAASAARVLFVPHERAPGAYVMWDGSLEHPVKIGCSGDPRARYHTVRKELPYLGRVSELSELEVVFVVLGYEMAERCLHRIFGDHYVNGDWFEAEPVIRWVSRLGWVLDETDALPAPMQRYAAPETTSAAGGRSAALETIQTSPRRRKEVTGEP
jgi:T5orf172 domain